MANIDCMSFAFNVPTVYNDEHITSKESTDQLSLFVLKLRSLRGLRGASS